MAMALAARSGRAGTASDGRISCPVCKQQIHPVAGRCKHCKTDLVKLREQHGVRAARVAPVVLGMAPPAPAPFAPAAPAPATARLSGQMAAAVPTIVSPTSQTLLDPPPYALPQAAQAPDALPPIAPYLYDETMVADAPVARRARWPIFVAIGAGIAIVICILLLVLDDKPARSSRSNANGIGRGTDSMDTDVAPPPNNLAAPGDPWGADPGADPGARPDDPPPTAVDPVPDPDPYQPPAPTPPPSTFNGAIPKAEDFYGTMLGAFCKKLQTCAGGNSTLDSLCDGGASLLSGVYSDQIKNGQCTYDENAAGRCLAAVDAFDCKGMDPSKFDTMLGIGDCASALSCSF